MENFLNELNRYLFEFYFSFGEEPQGKAYSVLSKVVEKAELDRDFRKRFIDSPRQVFEEFGYSLPAQLNIQIIDSGPLEKVLVLPPLLDKERFAKFDVSRANLQYESLIYKACVDEAFRKRLLEAPLETLRETGLTIKASERVRVIECGEDEIIFPLHSLKGYFKEGAPLAERTLPRITGRELKVKLPARVDAVSSIKLEEDFSQIREDAVLDFSQVEYISSAGLRLLLVLRKRLDSQNLRLILQNLSPSVRHVFELTGLDKYLL